MVKLLENRLVGGKRLHSLVHGINRALLGIKCQIRTDCSSTHLVYTVILEGVCTGNYKERTFGGVSSPSGRPEMGSLRARAIHWGVSKQPHWTGNSVLLGLPPPHTHTPSGRKTAKKPVRILFLVF